MRIPNTYFSNQKGKINENQNGAHCSILNKGNTEDLRYVKVEPELGNELKLPRDIMGTTGDVCHRG